MLRKIGRHIRAGCRPAVVMMALGALVISGAGAAQRLFEEYRAPDTANDYIFQQTCLSPTPQEADEASGKMAGGSRPDSEPAAELQTVALLPAGLQTPRLLLKVRRVGQARHFSSNDIRRPLSFVSVSQVSAQVGRTLTLVGSRPSGTS